MCALNDDIKVVWVVVHVVLLSVESNRFPNFILELCCDGMFAGVHVRHFRLFEARCKCFPRIFRDVVCLANVQAPDATTRLLQNF